MKKFILILIMFVANYGFTQIRSNGSTSSTISGQSPFLDASASPFTSSANSGKGIAFPRTDLTAFTFNPANGNAFGYPTGFDGFIVYNTTTGNTPATGSGIGNQAVTPGFYYFENTSSTGTTATGEWLPLGGGSSSATAATVIDADSDTHIQVEEGADEDIIRFDTAGTERAVIDAEGNVGIGTADPTNSLHIDGANGSGINLSDNANAGNNLYLKMYHGGASGKGMGFVWNDVTNSTGGLIIQSLSNTGGFVSNLHNFTRNGNVGIGTTDPDYTLSVDGTAQVTGALHDSDGDAGTAGQVLSTTATGTDWIDASSSSSLAAGTQGGNTLYWDGSNWVETEFLNHDLEFVAGGGNTLEGPPVSEHVLSSVPQEFGLSHSADGNYLYSTTQTGSSPNRYGIQVIDISNPALPVLGSLTNLPDHNSSNEENFTISRIKDNHIYFISESRIVVYDISTPNAPSLVQDFYRNGISGNIYTARINGDYLYTGVFGSLNGIEIFDISNPGSLSRVNSTNTGGSSSLYALAISGDILYVGNSTNDMKVYNISTPSAPVLLKTYSREFRYWRSLEVIAERYLYAAVNDELIIFDVIDPSNPVELTSLEQGVGAVPTPFRPLPDDMYIFRNSLVIGDQTSNQVHYIDVSDPAAPSYQYTYTAPIGGTSVFNNVTNIISTGTSSYFYAIFGGSSGMNTIAHDFNDANISRSVGIGTTSPDQTLSVNGNASKVGGGSWATFSDQRVKKNVRSYEKGLDEILKIQPVVFKYNEKSGYSDTTKNHVGVIAQDIERILPSTVTLFDDSNGPSGLSDKRQFESSEILWTLVNAVKELQAQNEKLKARIKKLEN